MRSAWLDDDALQIDFGGIIVIGHWPAICFGAESPIAIFGADYGGFASGGVGSTAIAASAIRQAAREMGLTLSDNQLRMLLGHAAFESGFGRGDPSRNTLANTNNYGSVQATRSFVQSNLGKTGFGAVAHQDSDPKKGPFVGWYAVYPNQVEGARAFLATVKPALSEDVDTYASNLYHRSYYSGFTTDAQSAIASYAKNIRAAMPKSVPAESPASIAEANRFSVGPLAPWQNRMTAKDKVDRKVTWPASISDAKAAWDKSWSSPAAYGLNLLGQALDFASVADNDGIVWLGPAPTGFSSPGLVVLAPTIWSITGAVLGALLLVVRYRLVGVLVGGGLGGAAGWALGGLASTLPAKLKVLAANNAPQAPAIVGKASATLAMTPALVKSAQAKLNALGFGPLKIDGVLGPATHSSLERFQKGRSGLMMTGLLDVATLKALGIGG